MIDEKTQHQTGWYLLSAMGIAVLALAGYSGYVLYPRFDLPAVSGSGLLILAAALQGRQNPFYGLRPGCERKDQRWALPFWASVTWWPALAEPALFWPVWPDTR